MKAFVELVQMSIKDRDGTAWLHWLPYCVLLGAVFFALSNFYFLTKGMKEYEALFMGSIFEGSLIFFACLSGGIVFKEFEVFAVWEFILYCLALFSIICGIFAVAKGSKPEDTTKAEPSPSNESEAQLDIDDITSKPAPHENHLEVFEAEANKAETSHSSSTIANCRAKSRHSSPFRGSTLSLVKDVTRSSVDLASIRESLVLSKIPATGSIQVQTPNKSMDRE